MWQSSASAFLVVSGLLLAFSVAPAAPTASAAPTLRVLLIDGTDACFTPDGDLYVAQFGREGPRHIPFKEPEGGVYRFIHAPWITPTNEPANPLNRQLIGDPASGQVLFEQRGCRQCHSIDGAAGALGPDLKVIGATLSVQAMRDALEQPSASIKTDYDTYQLTTVDGDLIMGRLLALGPDAVRLMAVGNETITIPRAQIEHLETVPMSLMPPGLLAGLEPQQVNDLLSFLQTLRSDPRVLRINCGGDEITDGDGRIWGPDRMYKPGGYGAVAGTISRHGELAEPLAKTCRFGAVHYRFDVDDGEYDLTLWLAEPAFAQAGKRVFSLFVQGQPVVENIDLFAEAGFATPCARTVRVKVTGGALEVTGKAAVNWPLISAIEVIAVADRPSENAAIDAAVEERSAGAQRYRWWHEPNRSLSLMLHGQPLWTLHFDPNADKPYLHPLRTVGGANLTWLRPSDHTWHRALWFSWKTINGVNYWEEDSKTGLSPGRSRITSVDVKPEEDGRARVVIDLSYHPQGKPAVMTERRTLTFHPPDPRGDYFIDVRQTFVAGDEGVTLERTDPAKQGWGGYAGLSLRADPSVRDWQFLDNEGRRDRAISSRHARWVDLSGTFGPADAGKPAGLTMIDHAANPRHPSPWYIVIRDAKDGPFVYFNAALLYHEPMTLKAGAKLNLAYRVLVHDGPADVGRIERAYADFNAAEADAR